MSPLPVDASAVHQLAQVHDRSFFPVQYFCALLAKMDNERALDAVEKPLMRKAEAKMKEKKNSLEKKR